jgi:hypothetical protein
MVYSWTLGIKSLIRLPMDENGLWKLVMYSRVCLVHNYIPLLGERD